MNGDMLNFRNYKIGTRLLLTTIGALVLMIIFVAIGLFSLRSIDEKVDHIVNNNIMKTELAHTMSTHNLLIARHVRTALVYEEIEKQIGERKKVEGDLQRYLDAENAIGRSVRSAKGMAIYDKLVPLRKAAEESTNRMFLLIKAGNRPDIEKHFFDDFQPKMQTWFDAIGELVALQKENNDRDVAEIAAIKTQVQSSMLLMIGFALLIMIPAGLWITRQITGPLKQAVRVADAVAAGNLDNDIDLTGNDESAQLMSALNRMQIDLKSRMAAERKVANEALRIKVALDVTSNSVMVSDPDGIIVYCNAAVLEMMRLAENDIRKDLDSGRPMNRLIQGDVGSGKTVIAALGASMVVANGAQAAIMAPTSILAEQHYRNFSSLLAGENGFLQKEDIRLLVGNTTESEKEAIRQ